MPFLFFGFLFMMMAWLFWAIVWVAVWAVIMLAWPIALLLVGVVLWRTFMRGPRAKRAGAFFRARSTAPNRDSGVAHSAFEEYRQETLRRLDEESAKFREFLERLRKSRDRKEFEAFMAARRRRVVIEGDATAS